MTSRSDKFMLCAIAALAIAVPAAAAVASDAYVSQVPSRGQGVPFADETEISPVFVTQMPSGARLRPARAAPRAIHFTAAKLFTQNNGSAALQGPAAITPLKHPSRASLPSVGAGVESQVNEPASGDLPTVGRGLLNS